MADDALKQNSVPITAKIAHRQRDIYLEMKRLENPNYSFIPLEKLLSAVNAPAPKPTPTKKPKPYQCTTQQNDTIEELFLGRTQGDISLWTSGSDINWIARQDGYPTDEFALGAAVATYRAAHQWNMVMEGRVTFRYVTRFDDAAFQLVYGGDRGDVYARAFPPDQWDMSLNTLYVYKKQFEKEERSIMVNTMLHELGHVLGCRHEHSQSGIPGFLPPEDQVRGMQSIIWGVRNAKSVMAYYRGQTIQESDVMAIRAAYDELNDGKVIMGEGKFGLVKKTIRRVKPNN